MPPEVLGGGGRGPGTLLFAEEAGGMRGGCCESQAVTGPQRAGSARAAESARVRGAAGAMLRHVFRVCLSTSLQFAQLLDDFLFLSVNSALLAK